MTKLFTLIFGTLLLSTTAFSKVNTEWYCNQRFDICVQYPAHFEPQGESQNGDGQMFSSKDGNAMYLVYGRLSSEYDNHFDAFIDAEESSSKVTYKKVKPTYCIMSGYTETGYIFYQKVKYLDDNYTSYWVMRIEYPKSQKKMFDAFCTIIANG